MGSYVNGDDVERSIRIGTRVVAETPTGTINGNNKDFTLANGRVVPSSAVVTSDGTGTTAFTITNDTGAISLTTAPSTSLVVTYIYVNTSDFDFIEADWTNAISIAEEYAEKKTGKSYVSETSITEWHDVEVKDWEHSSYATGGINKVELNNFQTNYYVYLKKTPVITVSHVYYTSINTGWGMAYKYDGASYTDVTTEVNSLSEDDVNFSLFDTGVITDYLYLGCNDKFNRIFFNLFTVAGGTGVFSDGVEYYNGTSWTSLSITDGTSEFTSSGWVSWTLPSDFSQATINSIEKYYIRLSPSTAFSTTNPTCNVVNIDNDYVITGEVGLDGVKVNYDNGVLAIMDSTPFTGFKRIKVDYSCGSSSGATEVFKELCSVLAGIGLLGAELSASANNVTSWNVRGNSATLGEAYFQYREALVWAYKRRDELLKIIGNTRTLYGDV